VQIGQIISSGISNVGGGTTALIISDLSRIFVLAAVDESDIGQVRPGQRVKVTVDAFRNREFSGEVVRISPRGANVSNVVTFEVKVEVTAPDKELLRPEMTATAEILIDERADALLAPADALFRRGGKTWATVVGPGGERSDREVTAGIGDGRRTEVLSGLAAGDTVLLQAANSKWNGQAQQRPAGPPPMMRLR
jgi:HlyD family secretion protein